MLFGVLLVAGNCAVLRGPYTSGLFLGTFSVLPMSNILAVACYRKLSCKSPVSPFFIGFGLSGAMAILIWFNFWLMVDEGWYTPALRRFGLGLDHGINSYTKRFSVNVIIFWLFSIFGFLLSGMLPQMMVAMTGGWIVRRYSARSVTANPGSRQSG
jgi:hypothetical protein